MGFSHIYKYPLYRAYIGGSHRGTLVGGTSNSPRFRGKYLGHKGHNTGSSLLGTFPQHLESPPIFWGNLPKPWNLEDWRVDPHYILLMGEKHASWKKSIGTQQKMSKDVFVCVSSFGSLDTCSHFKKKNSIKEGQLLATRQVWSIEFPVFLHMIHVVHLFSKQLLNISMSKAFPDTTSSHGKMAPLPARALELLGWSSSSVPASKAHSPLGTKSWQQNDMSLWSNHTLHKTNISPSTSSRHPLPSLDDWWFSLKTQGCQGWIYVRNSWRKLYKMLQTVLEATILRKTTSIFLRRTPGISGTEKKNILKAKVRSSSL